MQFSNDDIARYYDTHQSSYSYFWSPTALHYGLWYDDTASLAEAIVNTNRFVVQVLVIDARDVVLDAGCGVGGTSLYIAETTGARVEGIALSEVQLKIAKKISARSVAVNQLNFSKQDYTCTRFKDSTFSKLFGIESICHANNKIDFLNEAYRIMKPGGRIAVVDAFLTKEHLDAKEQKIYRKVIDGWVLPNLPTQTQFCYLLEESGFNLVAFHDMQRYIEKSVGKIYIRSLLTSPINLIKSKLGIARENLAAWYQKALFEKKIAIYGAFIAEKPFDAQPSRCSEVSLK